jgi:hypothetical protein
LLITTARQFRTQKQTARMHLTGSPPCCAAASLPARRPTRPTAAAIERRLDEKLRRAAIKYRRRKESEREDGV